MSETLIHQIYQDIQSGKSIETLSPTETQTIIQTIKQLDEGTLRVAEKIKDKWHTHSWVKEAILLYFRFMKMSLIQAGDLQFFDKIPVKKWSQNSNVRAVPMAIARYGSFLESGVILMPSYVNIGARIGSGTMVDTWATVGSCAQIGKNVHLSGGVGIGGVLEPIQASPVIIEDNAFIGSRSIIVEGAHIEEGAVIGAGVTITSSTKIIDVSKDKEIIYQGKVPANSVVIPGTTQKKFQAGTYGVSCALIIGQRKPSTDLKTSLTEALRDFQIQA